MLPERMVALGTARSVIRELFEFGKQRAAVVGADNVFDFSIGNPSVPAPPAVNETAMNILSCQDPVVTHGYTSASGDLAVREQLAASLNRRFGTDFTAANLYLTMGAAAALCCVFHALACPGDEFILLAPYFTEYDVFVRGNGGIPVVVPPDYATFQPDMGALEAAKFMAAVKEPGLYDMSALVK